MQLLEVALLLIGPTHKIPYPHILLTKTSLTLKKEISRFLDWQLGAVFVKKIWESI
jgi:hypothetical protein